MAAAAEPAPAGLKELNKLNELGSRLWHAKSLREGLDAMLAAAIELLGAQMGNVQLLDLERRALVIVAHHGFRQDFLDFFREVSADDETACGRSLRTRARTVIEDVDGDASYAPFRAVAHAAGYRAVQSTPLIGRDGTALGMLSTHFHAVHRPSEADLARLDLYARLAADFIERSRAEEALQASERRFRDMADAARGAERALRAKEAELALVAESTPVILTRCGRDLRYRFINHAGATLLGSTPEQVVGRRIQDVMGEKAFEVIRPHIERVLRGEPVEYENEIPYGPEARWVRVNYIPDFDAQGVVAGWIASIVDITPRKRAEIEAKRLYDALQEADRRKDEFIAILAHELRNPLAPVRYAAHYLQHQELADPESRRAIDMIERQVALMSRLIEDLLDVSRMTRGLLELRRERVTVADVVEAAVESCRYDIDSRRHELHVAMPTASIALHGDRARLIQALCNLIMNAAKYSPPGGRIELVVRTGDGEVAISVRDRGVGIPAHKLGEIFELFSRIDHTLERQGGLGIGLTLARQIAQLHGGTIEARSEGAGKGSEFLLRLPFTALPEVATAPPAASPAGASKRILVVDDNSDAVEGLAMLLERAGHEVHRAHDGEQALECAERVLPDLILLDIGMPKLNGYDVARSIRASDWGGKVRLVALTGWGHDDDRRRARDAGFDAHMVKPVAPDALDRLLAGITIQPSG